MPPSEPEWVSPATERTDADQAARGRVRVRTIHQLRRALPLESDLRGDSPPLTTRPFRPGQDEDGWLAVNNRAFVWHPEQGGWDVDRLRSRLAEPWVDLEGFLVHDDDAGRIDGFCWTKVHPARPDRGDEAAGEIFVVAADPSRHGTGLGRALVLAGLDHLASLGLRTAMLYVESDNEPALRLYGRLGFGVHHDDALYAPAQP